METACLPEFCAPTHDAALDPTRSRITCIGCKNDHIEILFCEPDERATLEAFWKFVDEYGLPVSGFAGYNTQSFDEVFLRIRSVACGLTPPQLRLLGDSADMMKILFPFGARFRSKDDVCRALGIDPPAFPKNGFDCPQLWHDGNVEAVKAHCLDDIRREWQLYKRLHEARLM